MSMDPQDWARGHQPDDLAPAPPVAPYAPAGAAPAPYGQGSAPAAASHARDPYAYDVTAATPAEVSYPVHAPGYPQTVYTPADHPPNQPTYAPAGSAYLPPAPPPYPTGPYPQPYVQGAYGQRSAYGEYSPTSYGASGYQPMPFAVLPALAGWGTRVAASLIDGIVSFVFLIIGFAFFYGTSTPAVGAYGNPTTEPTATGALVLLGSYLVILAFGLWNRTFRQGRTGQSIGKQAMHIRLVKESTMAPTGALLSFARDLAHQVDGMLYIGYLWPLWDAKRQTLADKICGTVVIVDP